MKKKKPSLLKPSRKDQEMSRAENALLRGDIYQEGKRLFYLRIGDGTVKFHGSLIAAYRRQRKLIEVPIHLLSDESKRLTKVNVRRMREKHTRERIVKSVWGEL